MFSTIASWVDRQDVRAVLVCIAGLTTVLLGPFVVMLVVFTPGEPLLFLSGLAGIAGLIGGGARIWHGVRFFTLAGWARLSVALLITAGICALLIAALAIPGNVFWVTPAPLAGLAWLVLLAGSVTGSGPGPNNSSKPMPLRGTA